VFSVQWSAAGAPTIVPVGPETALVVQGRDTADGRGRVLGTDSEATDLSLVLDVSEPIAEPAVPPAIDPPTDPEPRAIPEGPDRSDGPAAVPVGSPAGRAIDAALDELAPGAAPVHPEDGAAGAVVAVERVRIDGPARPGESPREPGLWPSRLAAILLSAGWFGRGVGPGRAGTARIGRRRPGR
jgi:hypothetical protein